MRVPFYLWPIVIELGEFVLRSETPLTDVLWFIGGLLLLALLTLAVLWWNRRAEPDPFV